MSRVRAAALVALALVSAAAVVPVADARTVAEYFQVRVYGPLRIWEQTASLPLAMTDQAHPSRYRVGPTTYVGIWNNVSISRTSTTEALQEIKRDMRYGDQSAAVFADRPLTALERRTFVEAAPLYRDADVLVLAAGHPACAGLTSRQAHDIATGAVTRWSQVGAAVAADTIKVRFRAYAESPEPRFGVTYVKTRSGRTKTTFAPGARAAADGGVGAAAGDPAVAAITSWSRAPRGRADVCVVPLDGVAPTDATVAGLSYPAAFQVTYVIPRPTPKAGIARIIRGAVRTFMGSEDAKAFLRRQGLLVVGDPLPAAGPVGRPAVTAPTADHAGRAITTTDAGAGAAGVLTGLRLDAPPTAEGTTRLVLDPQGTLRRLTFDPTGFCTRQVTGGWTIAGAWRYAEHGGGLIVALGWFLDDPQHERIIDLPDTEPTTAYVDGQPYARTPGAAGACGP